MKRKGLIIILLALVCLLFVLPSNKDVKADGESWNLVTNVAGLAVGDEVVIVAKEFNFAMSTTQNNNNRGQVAITKGDGTVIINNNVQKLTLEAGTTTGTFAFYTDSGYLYAASSGSNHLKTQATKDANGSWKIEIASSGVATIKAQGSYTRNFMQYNQTSSLFSCYASDKPQKDICLYKKDDNTPEVTVPTEISSEDYKTIIGTGVFGEYYNNGSYTRNTKINVNLDATIKTVGDKEIQLKESLAQYFHASNGEIDRISLTKETFFKGDFLWFNDENGNGHGYGTTTVNGEKYLSSNSVVNGVEKNSKATNIVGGMEDYYCTLDDFVNGTHTSSHVGKDENKNNKTLDLTSGWIYDPEAKEYYNEQDDVINAFILFTAPTWLPLKEDTANYFTFSKAVVKEDGDSLVMQLIVEGDEGKLVTDANNIFSQAVITDDMGNFEKAFTAAQNKITGTTIFANYNLTTELDGYPTAKINWSGTGVSNNVLIYEKQTNEAVPVTLTATVTIGNISRSFNVNFEHGVYVESKKATIVSSNLGLADKTNLTKSTIGDITLEGSKGSNSSSTPKYYTTGTALRIYGGNTLKISAPTGYIITSVVFTTGTGSYVVNSTSKVTSGTLDIVGNIATISGINVNSVTFTQGGSSGHVRITQIVVNYQPA